MALDRVRAAGVQVGRVQLSSALKVMFPDDETGCRALAERLRRFADSTYLHQVIERRDGTLRHFPDLDVALDNRESPAGAEWRIHFHVPLFTAEYDGLGSTQNYVRQVLDLAGRTRFARHFEIETYTWDVLPVGLKIDLLESIGREYRLGAGSAALNNWLPASSFRLPAHEALRDIRQRTSGPSLGGVNR